MIYNMSWIRNISNTYDINLQALHAIGTFIETKLKQSHKTNHARWVGHPGNRVGLWCLTSCMLDSWTPAAVLEGKILEGINLSYRQLQSVEVIPNLRDINNIDVWKRIHSFFNPFVQPKGCVPLCHLWAPQRHRHVAWYWTRREWSMVTIVGTWTKFWVKLTQALTPLVDTWWAFSILLYTSLTFYSI